MFKGMLYSIILLSFFNTNTFADDKEPELKRPAKITCKLLGTAQGLPREVNVVALDTEMPNSDIPDTSPMGLTAEEDSELVTMGFSNECDNGYDLSLLKQNLDSLAKREVLKITGTLSGGSSGNDFPSESRSVSCKLTLVPKKK